MSTNYVNNKRLLNIELLRIFAMLLILIWHINGHYSQSLQELHPFVKTGLSYISYFIPFHVNLFVLISGYFGIKRRWHSFMQNYVMCVFYSLFLALVVYIISGQISNLGFMPFSNGLWWFMAVYMLLALIVPTFESNIKSLADKEVKTIVAVFLFIDVYLAYGWENPLYYNHGYDLVHFITIYLIGVWIRRGGLSFLDNLQHSKILCMLVILSAMLCNYKLQPFYGMHIERITDYNSPINILMTVACFYIFLQVRVKEKYRKIITYFSSSVLSVYLVTDHPQFREILANFLARIINGFAINIYIQITIIAAFVVLAYTLCCSFDKLRIIFIDYCSRLMKIGYEKI